MVYQWLGMLYENGNGVAQNYAQAKAYYQKYFALSNDDVELKRLERKMAEGAEKRAGHQPHLGLFGGSPPGQTAVLSEAGPLSCRR
jgi:TPR repeat protein